MRFAGQRAAVFERAREMGYKGVTSNDAGRYTCHECGTEWYRRERRAWWPISLRWSWPKGTWFSWHGAQIGADAIEQKVVAGFLRIGPVVVRFGWREEYR